MKRSEAIRWGRYIRHMANQLGLRDWTLTLETSGCPDDALACVTPTEGRKLAIIRLCDDWLDLTADDQRHCIAHELIHCHFDSADNIVRLDARPQMSQSAYDVMLAGFVRQMEYGVDGLADAIAPLLPLPK